MLRYIEDLVSQAASAGLDVEFGVADTGETYASLGWRGEHLYGIEITPNGFAVYDANGRHVRVQETITGLLNGLGPLDGLSRISGLLEAA